MGAFRGARDFIQECSRRWFFAIVWVPLLVVYLATASWTPVIQYDPVANVLTAWSFAESGSFVIEDDLASPPLFETQYVLIADGPKGRTSIYPPGAALLATPVVALWGADLERWAPGDSRRVYVDEPIDIVMPAPEPTVLVAVVATSLAMAIAAMVALDLATRTTVLLGTWLLGLGTGVWSVAANALWQHGPAMLWLNLGVFLASRKRFGLSGLAFGCAVLTRSTTAVIVATLGLYLLVRYKDRDAFLRLSLGSLLGLAALSFYNKIAFDTYSPSGGYPDWFVEGTRELDLSAFVGQVVDGFTSADRGLLIYSPFILFQIIGITRIRQLPPVLVGSALGGVLYVLVQWKMNWFGTGGGFFSYRFPLETIAVSTPLLIASWSWIKLRAVTRVPFLALSAYSVLLMGAAERILIY